MAARPCRRVAPRIQGGRPQPQRRTLSLPLATGGNRAPVNQWNHVFGAGRDLEARVRTHLFCISPNHSGSTFLQLALATCRGTWNLHLEGEQTLGFVGPRPLLLSGLPRPNKFWALHPRHLERLADPGLYNWPRTRKAWYFQAYARSPDASVFVVKSPRNLFQLDMLVQHFRNAKFLFMVRNPYAAAEGVCRSYRSKFPEGVPPAGQRRVSLEGWAATHLANCLAQQRRNLQGFADRGAFFTYEAMCAQPERVAQAIKQLVPELDELNLRQRLPVKRLYNEMLTDMNARQLARLDPEQIAAMNAVFRPRRELLEHFGYDLMDASGASRVGGHP